jgi:hypothetical protein
MLLTPSQGRVIRVIRECIHLSDEVEQGWTQSLCKTSRAGTKLGVKTQSLRGGKIEAAGGRAHVGETCMSNTRAEDFEFENSSADP